MCSKDTNLFKLVAFKVKKVKEYVIYGKCFKF